MSKNPLARPFLKWAGGKRQLLPEISRYVPKDINKYKYYEPFAGAGAVLFHLQPKKAVINDFNSQLINAYQVIKDDVDNLIEDLKSHRNEKEYFYELREIDRTDEFKYWSDLKRASRLIYLNKTCFNGLFRVNSKNQFNVPFGNYKNPNIVNEPVLRGVSAYLNNNDVEILSGDFEDAIVDCPKGAFVYMDPPYDSIRDDSDSFVGYTLNGFSRYEQIRLRDAFADLDKRGCKVLLSNARTPFIEEIYKGYKIVTVEAARSINSKGNGRGKVEEVLVMNYEPEE